MSTNETAPVNIPKILAILPGFMPTTLMYIIKPFLCMEAEGLIRVRIELEAYFDVKSLGWADLVVFCRNVEPTYSYVLDAVRASGIPYIYDIDDNLFEVPAEVVDGEYYRAPERTALLTRYLQSASLVRVYSQLLQERVRTLNPNVCQVTPALDWGVVRSSARSAQDRVKIVYATSRRDDYLFPIFTEALRRLMRTYPDQVEMHFWGFQPAGFRRVPNVYTRRFDPNYNAFMRRFSSAGFDIGLAPMLDDDFHRAKTNTKFREYGACGIAGVYSNVPLYADRVENGVTGLLVHNTPVAWYTALEKLVKNAELRQQIGAAARLRVKQEYSQERFQQVWMGIINDVLARPRPARVLSARPAGSAVPTTAEASAAPVQASAPSPALIWRAKLNRAVELVRSGQIARSIFNGRVHINNLWWLFKINRLKRL